MAWGKRAGVDDLLARLQQPATSKSLYVLSTRSLTDADAQKLAGAIAGNAQLEELYLSGHKLGAPALDAFADCLAQNAALKHICVGHDSFGDDGVRALCGGLASNPRSALQVWDLEYKGVTSAGAAALGDLLARSSTPLSTLTLSRNKIGDDGVKSLAAGLAANPASKLATLTVTDAELSGRSLDQLADVLVQSTCAIETLTLSFNDLGSATSRFFDALASNKSLKTLQLKECKLNDAHATALGEALAKNTTLEQIDLSDNQLTAAACAALANGLSSSESRVKSLKLGSNRIGDDGAAELARGLASSASTVALAALDVSKNALSSTGMVALLSVPSLRTLNLFDNSLGAGLSELLPALAANQTIETLDLGANALHGALSVTLFDVVHAHPSLSTLEMGGNSLGEEGHAALDKLRAANPRLDVAVDKNVQDENGNM